MLNGQYRIAMNMPNMVASFVYPVTMSLIPFAAAALARKDHAEADRIISSAFRLIAILALPAGVGLSVLSTPIELLMLPMQPEDALAAGPHLQILGIALIFICLMILTNAILQTYGKEKLPIFTVIAGGVVKVVMNYILVGNPDINIHGAPISTLCCYLTICGLNLFFVWKYSPEKPRYIAAVRKAHRSLRRDGRRRLGSVRPCCQSPQRPQRLRCQRPRYLLRHSGRCGGLRRSGHRSAHSAGRGCKIPAQG